MIRFLKYLCVVGAVAVAVPSQSSAQTSTPSNSGKAAAAQDVPRTLNYQGVLTSASGQPLADGEYQITARLYSDAAGTQKVWEGVYTTSVHNGLFNLTLGSGDSPLPAPSAMSTALFTGIQIGNTAEMRPLTSLAATPYALNVSNGAITKEKMGTDYVGSLSINGQKVTDRGGNVNFVTGDGVSASVDPGSNNIVLATTPTMGSAKRDQISANTVVTGTLTVSGLTTLNGGLALSGSITFGSLGTGVVHSNSTGTLSSSAVALGTDVSGTLPLANGGTGGSNTSRSANTVFAGPASGGSGAASFRTLASADIPNNAANTSGSAGSFTGSLSGDVTGTQGATVLSNIPALDGSALTHLSAGNLSGTLPALDGSALTHLSAGNLSGTLPALDGSALTHLSAGNLSGALPALDGSALTLLSAGSLSGALPALDGSALTFLTANNLQGTLPALDGSNLTNLNASALSSGTVPTARLGSGTADNTTYLRGDGTWATVSGSGGSGWGLSGNALTGGEFLGTTTNDPIVFKTNGSTGMTLTTNGALNVESGANGAGYQLGGATIVHNSGNHNIYVGEHSGEVATLNAERNSTLGYQAGAAITTGSDNNLIGYQTGYSIQDGQFNTMLGSYAGYSTVSGEQNIFVGSDAGYYTSSGTANVFTGWRAGRANTTGNHNTFVGHIAGITNETGYNNTTLGAYSDVTEGIYNATAIGANAKVTISNALTLGGVGGDAANVGIGVSAPQFPLDVVGVVNTSTGYKINGALAASGHFLRGDGTKYVDGTIQIGDVADLNAAVIQNQSASPQTDASFSIDGSGTFGADVNFTADHFHQIHFNGSAPSGDGNYLSITGQAADNGTGGPVYVAGGDAGPGSGNGGDVFVQGGTASSGTAGRVGVYGSSVDIQGGGVNGVVINNGVAAGTTTIGAAGATGSGDVSINAADGKSIGVGADGAANVHIGTLAADVTVHGNRIDLEDHGGEYIHINTNNGTGTTNIGSAGSGGSNDVTINAGNGHDIQIGHADGSSVGLKLGNPAGNVLIQGSTIDIEDPPGGSSSTVKINANPGTGTVQIGNAGSTGSGQVSIDAADGSLINIGNTASSAVTVNVGNPAANVTMHGVGVDLLGTTAGGVTINNVAAAGPTYIGMAGSSGSSDVVIEAADGKTINLGRQSGSTAAVNIGNESGTVNVRGHAIDLEDNAGGISINSWYNSGMTMIGREGPSGSGDVSIQAMDWGGAAGGIYIGNGGTPHVEIGTASSDVGIFGNPLRLNGYPVSATLIGRSGDGGDVTINAGSSNIISMGRDGSTTVNIGNSGGYNNIQGTTTMESLLNMNNQQIQQLAEPGIATDAATKNYVDTYHDATKLDNFGGTMSGDLDMGAGTNYIHNVTNPSSDQDAATKRYVDDADNAKLSLSGTSDALNMNSHQIHGVADPDPMEAMDAANVGWVHAAIGSGIADYISAHLNSSGYFTPQAIHPPTTGTLKGNALMHTSAPDTWLGNTLGKSVTSAVGAKLENHDVYQSGGGPGMGIGTDTPRASLDVAGTDAIIVPVGQTVERPVTPVKGMIRFNTTTNHFEGYNGTKWRVLDVGAE